MSPNPGIRRETRAQLLATVDLAAVMGARVVSFNAGHKSPFGIFDRRRLPEYLLDTMGPVVNRARALGVTLALENSPRRRGVFGVTAEECGRFLTLLGPEIAFTLDVGHAHTLGGNSAVEFARAFRDRLATVHLSDNQGEHDEHLTPGLGSVPWRQVLEELEGFEGGLILEVLSLDNALAGRAFLAAECNQPGPLLGTRQP